MYCDSGAVFRLRQVSTRLSSASLLHFGRTEVRRRVKPAPLEYCIICAVLGLLILAACGTGPHPAPKANGAQPAKVAVKTAEMIEWKDSFEAPGTVRARTSSVVGARVMGYVREINVRPGDVVAAGAVIATMEARELDAAVRQAESGVAEARAARPEAESAIRSARAQLELAETTHRRIRELFEKRSVSRQELDEAQARVQVARAAVEMAEARRKQVDEKIRQGEEAVASARVMTGFTVIRAPFAGRVIARLAEPGVVASPGMPLVEIEEAGAYRLEAQVEESRLAAVRRGQPVEVRFEAIEKPVQERVDEIVPAVDEASRTFTVKISLPAFAGIRSGLFGRAKFTGEGTRQALAVDRSSLRQQGQLQQVFVAEGGVARLRMVRLGEARGGMVEVLSGLTAGEQVITPFPANLADGARVEAPQ